MFLKHPHWLLIFFFFAFNLQAQVEDDFSDGDLTVDPTWFGATDKFVFDETSGLLRSNGPSATASYYISTSNNLLDRTSWEFRVKMNLNPSGGNNCRVFLVSDQVDVSGDLNGYFLQLGEALSADGIDLYKKTGNVETKLADGPDGQAADFPDLGIKVVRNDSGEWTIYVDLSGGTNYNEIYTFTDKTFTSNSYFGFVVNQTSTNRSNYYFGRLSVYEMLEIESLSVVNKNLIQINFNLALDEASSSAIENYLISDGVEVLSASRSAGSNAVIELTTTTLTSGEYDLFIGNLTDNTYGRVSGELQAGFSYTVLSLEQILTPNTNEIRLLFNDDLGDDLTTTDFLLDNGIGNPAAVQLNPLNPREIILTLEEALTEQPYALSFANDVFNSTGNSQIDQGTSFGFEFEIPLIAESIEVTDKNSLLLIFNKTLEPSAAEILINYEVTPGIGQPGSATLSGSGDSVVLTFEEAFGADTYSLAVTSLTSEGGAELQPNPTVVEFSYLPMEVLSVSPSGENTLLITFNQEPDPLSAQSSTNYQLNDNFGNPVAAVLSESHTRQVELTFAEAFFNFSYELAVDGIQNAAGNSTTENLVAEVLVAKPTPAGALVITEIFADPNPKGLAPETQVLPTTSTAEFVEIFNTTPHSISLNGFALSGGQIGDLALTPGAYLALVPESHFTEYQTFGNAAAVSAWNTLTNSGEQIVLTDQLGNVVDEVTFSSSWYGDPEKNGGWSLEKINPTPACESAANWAASTDQKGASPGAENAVFDDSPDTTAPEVASVEVIGEDLIRFHFDEQMDVTSLEAGSIVLQGYVIETQAAVGAQSAEFQLDRPLISEIEYVLELEGFADCAGNLLAPVSILFYYDKKGPVLERLVVRSFSSLLLFFDEPLNEQLAETEQNYLLSNIDLAPANATLSSADPSQVLLKFDHEFVLGASYQLSVNSILDTLGNEMLPENNREFIVEQNIDSVWVEGPGSLSLLFSEDADPHPMAESENYQLDGLFPHASVVKSLRQTTLVFAENFAENKDLTLSVSNLTGTSGNELITPDYTIKYDTRAPAVAHLNVLNHHQLLIGYDEAVTTSSAENLSNYTYNDILHPAEASYQKAEKQVLLSFVEPFPLETLQELKIHNVTDLFGNSIKTSQKRNFVYDTLAPRVKKLVVAGPLELRIEFSEPITPASVDQLTNFALDGMSPVAATRHLPDSSIVDLRFGSLVPPEGDLVINNIADFTGNVASGVLYQISNKVLVPAAVTVHSENLLEFCFNKDLANLEASTIYIGQLGISKKEIIEEDHCLLLTLADRMTDGVTYSAIFSGLTGATGEQIDESEEFTFTYFSYVEKLVSNNPTSAELLLTVPVQTDSLRHAFFQVQPGELQPAVALADAENSTLIRLYFDTELPQDLPLELEMSGIFNEWGHHIPDQTISFSIDAHAPTVDSVYTVLFNQLTVEFSEQFSTLTGLAPNHYVLIGEGMPNEVQVVEGAGTSIRLSFDSSFTDGQTYQLAVRRIEDLAGNVMEPDTIAFSFYPPAVPEPGKLLITEIMADPSPVAGLPDSEFVEIYNIGSSAVDLSTVSFSDDAKTFVLDGELEAGAYLILCPIESAAMMASYGNVLGISGWSALSNAGDSLSLVNYFGEVVDQVVYSDSWYKDTSRDDGGFSLERIYATAVCDPGLNWNATLNETGGTPGSENSVWNDPVDTLAPLLNPVEILNEKLLQLSFDEVIHPETAASAQFIFTPHLTISTINLASNQVLQIVLEESLSASERYTLSVSGITDCFGNESESKVAEFAIGEAVAPGDIIITEVMADPSPVVGLPEAEYLEIYNRSEKLINLQQLVFEDEGTGLALNGFIGPGEYRLLTSASSQEQFDFAEVVGLVSFPSLTNSGELLALKDTSGTVIDELHFDLTWYADPAKDDGGYALERILADPLCSTGLNWAASADERGGTPGSENSLWNSPVDNEGPYVSEVNARSETEVTITLNEAVYPASVDPASFSISAGITIASVEVEGLQVHLTLANELGISVFYEVTASGITDCFGNLVSAQPVGFALGERVGPGDIIFSEIMADPTPVNGLPEAEFVEIYNRSTKLINLQQLVYADEGAGATLDGYLGPGEYLLLFSATAASFFGSAGVLALENFPALTNSGERLQLQDTSGIVIDEVIYELSWYKDQAKDDGGYSLERINPGLLCSGPSNWTSSVSSTGGTPGFQNSVHNGVHDKTPPALLDVRVQSNASILLLFSKGLDADKINGAAISVDSGPAIVAMKLDDLHKEKLTLELEEELASGKAYQLLVGGIADCEGNILEEAAALFGVGRPPAFGELLITEIMADPEPSAGLPEAEFLEFYNASEDWISLEEVNMMTGSKAVPMPAATIAPHQYLVIAPAASASQFNEFGKVLALSEFPTLKNEGDNLSLYVGDSIIYAVSYSPSLLASSIKKDGGWSLELIDTSQPCAGEDNWVASQAVAGGTPGQPNSVAATLGDGFGPAVLEVLALNDSTLSIKLSERLRLDALALTADIVPETAVEQLWYDQPLSEQLYARLTTKLMPGISYTISINGLVDCLGNLPSDGSTTASFILPEPADSLDLVINEILFNPRSGGVDFVEIFNHSGKYIDLKGWQLGNVSSSTGEIGNFVTLGNEPLVISPAGYRVFTESPTVLKADYPTGKEEVFTELRLPSYPNSEGGVVLLDAAGKLMDRFDYSEDYHLPFLREVKGVSLERVSPAIATNETDNWHSATSSAGFATPGYRNSTAKATTETQALLLAEPRTIIGGEGSAYFYFDSSLSNTRLTARIFDLNGRVVKTLLDGETVGQGGFASWDGSSDLGELVRVGIYIVQLEFFNVAGQQEVIRTTVAVGGRF